MTHTALLRKYYDSAVINVYSNLYLKDHFSIETFIVEKINNWLQGREQIPEYRVMSQYIRASPTLMMSSDHLDALQCNMEPEENSQYWVAPFIQDLFLEVLTPRRPDIAAAIKANSAMQLL